ncbi:MAG: hypothetical protein H6R01_2063 [Burkholderiaceae bacterium]|nr:hypothetical protein [Burkholderiaceae bacterium]
MKEHDIAETRRKAEELFQSGLNCAESALLALAKMQHIEAPVMPGIATCFGGGMALTGGTCGALTGSVMGLGLAFGRVETSDSIQTARAATKRLVNEFEHACGGKDCHVLLAYEPNDALTHQVFSQQGRRDRCANYTGQAVELAARIILEKKGG